MYPLPITASSIVPHDHSTSSAPPSPSVQASPCRSITFVTHHLVINDVLTHTLPNRPTQPSIRPTLACLHINMIPCTRIACFSLLFAHFYLIESILLDVAYEFKVILLCWGSSVTRSYITSLSTIARVTTMLRSGSALSAVVREHVMGGRAPTAAAIIADMEDGKRCWLMKTDPGSYSIDTLKADGVTPWDGVRNFQARNFMRDAMRKDDQIIMYHSGGMDKRNKTEPGVVGLARIVSETPYPDHTAWDRKDPHYDPKSPKDNPRWFMVDVAFVEKFQEKVTLKALKAESTLDGMMCTRRGARLSIQPLSFAHYEQIVRMARDLETK